MKTTLLYLSLLFSFFINAQTLYWVGGSGNLNDAKHWSLESGGISSGLTPSATSDLIIDNNSALRDCYINIDGIYHIKSIQCLSTIQEIHFTGDKFSSLNCSGDFMLNAKTYYDASSNLIFLSNSTMYQNINFWKNTINADVTFEDGSWNLIHLKVGDNNLLKFNKGKYSINNTSVISGNFEAKSGQVTFSSIHSTFYVKNNLMLGKDVTFNSNDLMFIANPKVPKLFNVDSQVNFGSNAKIISPSPQACTITYSFTSPSCAASCNASITIGFAAGCAAGTYSLTFNTLATCVPPGVSGIIVPTTYVLGGLCQCAGNLLDIFVYDAVGFVTQLNGQSMPGVTSPINNSFTVPVDATCFGKCDGSVKFTLSGGNGPYTATITPSGATFVTNGFTANTASVLCAGTQTLNVTDNNGCQRSFTTSVSQPTAIAVNGSSSNISCNGACTGAATVSPTGGTPPYTYLWTSGVPTNTTTTGSLCVGMVTATVVDSKTCSITYTANISATSAIILTVNTKSLTCSGVPTGAATITATGGQAPFTYSINGVSTTSVIPALSAGNYTASVKDALGCLSSKTFTISSPPTFTTAPTQNSVICNGAATATINLNPSGGTPAYSYTWSPAAASSSINANVVAGVYSYTVGDANGCRTSNSVTISQPSATTLTVTKTNITCNGSTNGSATITPTGGTSPFSYTWSPVPTGQGTATITNLSAQTYTANIRDANGCSTSTVVTITQPSSVTISVATVQPKCNGGSNGSITITATNGSGVYTYSLQSSSSTVAGGPVFSGLSAGSYTVIVNSGVGCTSTKTVTLGQPSVLTLTLSATPISCFSQTTSIVTSTVGGGTPTYTINWSTGALNTTSLTGQGASVITATVTDANSCSAVKTITITAPTAMTVTAIAQTTLACFTSTNAIATATAIGGTPSYTYTWSNGVVGSTNSNLGPGTFTVTAKDVNNCTQTQTVNIIAPPATTLTVTKTNITCNGLTNGSATITPIGGASPFSYTWSPVPTGQGTATITNLSAQTYTANVRDANGCTSTTVVTITQPSSVTISVATVQPKCNGVSNGSITVTATNGSGVYTYSLQSSSSTVAGGPVFSGLSAGSYTVIVNSGVGCTSTKTVTLGQPSVLTLTLSATPISCFSQTTSIVTSTVGGGTPTYTINWSTGALNTTSLTGQGASVITATVTDANSCSAVKTITITAPTAMTVTAIAQTTLACFTSTNAIATATAIGGTPSYTYTWSNGVVGSTNSNLGPGTFTVTAKDVNNCTQTQTVSIIAPPALTLTASNGTVGCLGVCNGTVGVLATGGTSGYTYSWNSIPTQTTAITSATLCNGSYTVTVTDKNSCTKTAVAVVSLPTPIIIAVSGIKASCNLCIGAATVTPSGGSAPYTYTWTNSASAVVSNTNSASNLCVGTYTVRVLDSKLCSATQIVTILPSLSVVLTTTNNTIQCNNGLTGIATVSVTSGTSPYTYSWSPAGPPTQTLQTATGLGAGTYSALVTDANGCSNTATVNFANPPATTLTISKTNETCFGLNNGTATVTALGGTGVHTYTWLPGGQTTTTISGLSSGIYTVNVSDANSCVTSQTLQIAQAILLTASFTYTTPATCLTPDGSIFATVNGGSPGYTYTWTPSGVNTNSLINVVAGNYILTVKDLASCTYTFVASLNSVTGPTLSVMSSSNACFGDCLATSTVTALGTAPLTYTWSSGATPTSSVATNLCSGIVMISVADGNGCIKSTTVNIASPTKLTASGIVSDVTCNSLSTGSINLTPTGGTTPYTYSWSPAGGTVQDPVNLPVGNYTCVTTDNNLCTTTNTFTVTQPATLTIAFNKKDASCFSGCTGGVKTLISGGTTPYSYTWTPLGAFVGASTDTIGNLCTGIYSVNVTDFKGCTIAGTISIGQPTAALTATATSTNLNCNAICNGSGSVTVTGGSSPYTYTWTNVPATTTSTVGGLCAGMYSVTINDVNGCSTTNTIDITQPSAITITVTGTNPTCAAACNGSVITNVNGGSPGYTYSWTPSTVFTSTLQNPTGMCGGNYSLVVTDNVGCTQQATVSITDPPVLVASISFTNPLCNGSCNGIATATAVGGNGGNTYSWQSPPPILTQTTQTISNLCSGIYTVTVTDVNLCADTKTVSITDPIAITVNPAVTSASCGVSNGSIDASSVTGAGPFTYNWLPPVSVASSTLPIVNGLSAGIYTVIVTSTSSSCSATATITLNNSNGPTAATITFSNATCNSKCDGIATISNVVGGTPSYTLSWVNPLSASSTVSNLCAGIYNAQVLDANNCLYFQSVTITEPSAIIDNNVITNAQCLGVCTGSITLAPFGGAGGYTYTWSNTALTTSSLTGLCTGPLTATVTDMAGCSIVSNYNILGITTIASNTLATNNICFGDCKGSIIVNNISGGLAPYNILWSDPNGQTNDTAIALCNGSYSVSLTDANGCVGVNSASITSNPQVVITNTVTQPNCNSCNGSATLTPSGGGGIFSYVWSNTQTVNPATNLCAGVYGVQVTDNLGCLINTNIVVNNSSGITNATINVLDETCELSCNGSVTVAPVGGVAPVTYNWVHNNSSSPIQSGLCAGNYFCNMTDANGCSLTASVVIGSSSSLTITSQVYQSSCSLNTGSIAVSVTGGTAPYAYTWLPAGNTPTVTGLAPGIYTLTVTDNKLCAKTQSFTVNSINGPVITSTVVNSSCIGVCSGSVEIAISGGSPGYNILWSNGSGGSNITSLCPGNYSVTVTDFVGCIAVQGYSINSSAPIIFSTPNLNNPKCFNDCNGSITTVPSGGSLPFTYSWSPSTSNAPVSSNLCSGTQTVIVTDIKGCIASQTFALTNPALLGYTASVMNPTCSAASNGSIGITPFGGTPSYSYTWTGGLNSSSQNLININTGTYSLSMSDANGCKKDTFIVITSTLVVNAVAGRDTVICLSGSFALDGSNSTGGATYDWLLLPSTSSISNSIVTTVNPAIGTSTYVLLVANGVCTDSDTMHVTVNALPIVDAGPFVSVPIYISTQIGGSPTALTGITYTWTPNFGNLDNPNSTNPNVTNTITTQYTVTVTDANGCTNFDTVTVSIYPHIIISSGFTPNSDGKNDVWLIDYLHEFPANVVEVYNRWGELLFYSQGYAIPFDGKYKGKDLPVGTYYYIIDLHSDLFPTPYTGPLTIFR